MVACLTHGWMHGWMVDGQGPFEKILKCKHNLTKITWMTNVVSWNFVCSCGHELHLVDETSRNSNVMMKCVNVYLAASSLNTLNHDSLNLSTNKIDILTSDREEHEGHKSLFLINPFWKPYNTPKSYTSVILTSEILLFMQRKVMVLTFFRSVPWM